MAKTFTVLAEKYNLVSEAPLEVEVISSGEHKSTHITIRLTIKDKENLKKLSEFHSLSIGAMIRKLATSEAQKLGL